MAGASTVSNEEETDRDVAKKVALASAEQPRSKDEAAATLALVSGNIPRMSGTGGLGWTGFAVGALHVLGDLRFSEA